MRNAWLLLLGLMGIAVSGYGGYDCIVSNPQGPDKFYIALFVLFDVVLSFASTLAIVTSLVEDL